MFSLERKKPTAIWARAVRSLRPVHPRCGQFPPHVLRNRSDFEGPLKLAHRALDCCNGIGCDVQLRLIVVALRAVEIQSCGFGHAALPEGNCLVKLHEGARSGSLRKR